MESWLQKLLARMTWLNVSDERLQAEFSAHVGWGLAMPLLMNLWGLPLWVSCWIWIAFSVYKEAFEDGHLAKIIDKTETPEEKKDFFTDLISRCLPSAVILLVLALF